MKSTLFATLPGAGTAPNTVNYRVLGAEPGLFAYYSWVCGPISEPSRLQGGETPEHTRNSHGWSHRAK